MKILFIVDFHGELDYYPIIKEQAKKADIIISAGDHTWFDQNHELMLNLFDALEKPVYLIHGNHETEEKTRKLSENKKNLIFCHGEKILLEDYEMLFWGGGGFSLIDDKLEKKLGEWVKSKYKKILVTHAPPYQTKLDTKPPHVGCETIRKAIILLKPKLAVSGHIHESEGLIDKLGESILINPGPRGLIIDTKEENKF